MANTRHLQPVDCFLLAIFFLKSQHSFLDFRHLTIFFCLLFSGHWPIQCLVIEFRVLPYRHCNMQTGHDDRQRLSSSHVFTNFEATNLRIFMRDRSFSIEIKIEQTNAGITVCLNKKDTLQLFEKDKYKFVKKNRRYRIRVNM